MNKTIQSIIQLLEVTNGFDVERVECNEWYIINILSSIRRTIINRIEGWITCEGRRYEWG
jgi:hypothetical protein